VESRSLRSGTALSKEVIQLCFAAVAHPDEDAVEGRPSAATFSDEVPED
jgi:hypothetical protein